MADPESSQTRLQRAMAAVRDENTLRTRLDEIVRRKGLQDVCTGVLVDGQKLSLMARGASAAADDGGFDAVSPSEAAVTAGCLAKSLTATLMSEAVAAGRVNWGDFATDVLSCGARVREHLAGITLRHLLDHSHGLDASVIAGVPHREDGFIDVEALCGELNPQPLSSPGQMYSYSHVGAWLAGAVLENIYGTQYVAQLRKQRLMLDDPQHELTTACPATGGDLALSVAQWLSFAHDCMSRQRHSGDALQEETKLPGWHPAERSIQRGWKHYGDGWLGHNANLPDRSAILRMNAREQLAIVMSAREANGAVFAASGVFGDLLPEFRNLRPPRLLKPDQAPTSQLREHVGHYVQARATVDITMDAEGALRLSVIERTSDQEPAPPRRLRPAEGGVFLAESGGDGEFLFVQFIANGPSSPSAYLWNGRQVWRRDAAAS